MKNKIILITSTTVLLLTTIFVGCKKSNTESPSETNTIVSDLTNTNIIYPEGDQITNEILGTLGIDLVYNINVTEDQMLQEFLSNNEISNVDFDFVNAKALIINGREDEFGIILTNTNNPNRVLTINITGYESGNLQIDKQCEVSTVYKTDGPLKSFNYNSNGFPSNIRIIDMDSLQTMDANPSELGPRRSGESFSACFERNWDNFSTDIPSKLAQATSPLVVAAAIAITCAPK